MGYLVRGSAVSWKLRIANWKVSFAVNSGHEAVVKLLLDTGKVDVNLQGSKGWTPLSLAASNGNEGVVKLLLETGEVDVNQKVYDGQTPLSLAARNGHKAVMRLQYTQSK